MGMRLLTFGFAVALVAAPAGAQSADPRWADWMGCWTLITEDERADAPAPAAAAIDRVVGAGAAPEAEASGSDAAPRVCVAPGEAGSVRLTTLRGEEVVHEQTIVADGRDHPLAGECTGTRRAEWSRLGLRLFSHAELHCPGAGARTGTSLTLIAPDGSWLDIEAVRIEARESLQVRRYRRVEPAIASARATAPWTLADVEEASRTLPPAVVEAALVETQAAFALNAREVVALADSGVPDRVIDLMVALSYPEKFVIERRVSPTAPFGGSFVSISDFWPYYYTPFGYSSADYYLYSNRYFLYSNRYFVGGPPIFVGVGGGGAVPPVLAPPTRTSTAVNEHGYTRVRPREAGSVAVRRPMNTSTGDAMTSGGTTSSPATASSSGGDGGGGGSASPQGYSRGDGGGGTGRTAVPR